jgi:hypothetical protein
MTLEDLAWVAFEELDPGLSYYLGDKFIGHLWVLKMCFIAQIRGLGYLLLVILTIRLGMVTGLRSR